MATITISAGGQSELDELGRLKRLLEERERQHTQLERQHTQLEHQHTQLEHQRALLEREKVQWDHERQELMVRIHHLTSVLGTRMADAAAAPQATQAQLLGAPVDAGSTTAEAQTKQQQREERERQREARTQAKNAKKGRGAGGAAKPVNGGGRKPVNKELTILTVDVPVPPHLRVGADGTPLMTLRWEIKEQESSVAAGLVRLITRLEVMGTADTHEYVVRAPTPPAIVPRSKYHDTLIIEMMVRKYYSGMPFYRVLQDVRAMGSDLTDATLSDLARGFAQFLTPLVAALRSQVLAEVVAHIDETTLPTQDGMRYLWAILAGRQVTFHIGGRTLNDLRLILGLPLEEATTHQQRRAAAAPDRDWRFAHVMADGYGVYDTVLAEAGIIRLNCWAHPLRDLKPFAADPVIREIMHAIGELYAVERKAKATVERSQLQEEEAIAVYTRLRKETSQPQLEVVHRLLQGARERYTTGSDQRKAIDFLLKHWPSFTGYAQRGDLPIDNNDVERVFRMIVVGRKNWMLIGSEDAAQSAADIFSVLESCRHCRIEPRAYLAYVVARMHAKDTPMEQLTPKALASKFPIRR